MFVGIGSYIYFDYFLSRPLGLHAIVPALALSLIAFLIVSNFTEEPSDEIIELFWGI
jgi:sodium/pantothenate symporter